jgi:hypothetical protein
VFAVILIVLFITVLVRANGLLVSAPPIYAMDKPLDPANEPVYRTPFNDIIIPPQQALIFNILISTYCLFSYENITDFPKKVLFDN